MDTRNEQLELNARVVRLGNLLVFTDVQTDLAAELNEVDLFSNYNKFRSNESTY